MKRIVIAGAESTGKTTLAEALAGYYGEPWTGEFVRQYVDGLDRPLERGDLEAIARGQLAQEDFALDKAERFIIHDTNLLSSILYAKHYFDAEIDWVNDQFLARDYSLYLLCLPDIPWVAEPGQRESPDTRERFHRIFKDSLDRLELPYLSIGGDHAHRLNTAVLAVDQVLGGEGPAV